MLIGNKYIKNIPLFTIDIFPFNLFIYNGL